MLIVSFSDSWAQRYLGYPVEEPAVLTGGAQFPCGGDGGRIIWHLRLPSSIGQSHNIFSLPQRQTLTKCHSPRWAKALVFHNTHIVVAIAVRFPSGDSQLHRTLGAIRKGCGRGGGQQTNIKKNHWMQRRTVGSRQRT